MELKCPFGLYYMLSDIYTVYRLYWHLLSTSRFAPSVMFCNTGVSRIARFIRTICSICSVILGHCSSHSAGSAGRYPLWRHTWSPGPPVVFIFACPKLPLSVFFFLFRVLWSANLLDGLSNSTSCMRIWDYIVVFPFLMYM